MYGTAQVSDHLIPPSRTLPVRVVIMIRGKPDQRPEDKLNLVLAITDDEGNEQRVRVAFRGFGAPPAAAKQAAALEAPFAINDPIEKEVVSVLQAELSRYDKCGRQVGGLGSVHLVYRGHAMTGVGSDSWEANSPRNQSIADDPDAASLQSDNLDAILALTPVWSLLRTASGSSRYSVTALTRTRVTCAFLTSSPALSGGSAIFMKRCARRKRRCRKARSRHSASATCSCC